MVAAGLGLIVSLTASAAGAQIRPATLEWDANTDGVTAGYAVFVGLAPGAPLATLDVGPSTRAVLPLPLGGRYFVAIRGYEASGALGPASVETEIDLVAAPGRPAGLTAVVNGANAEVSWAPPSPGPAALSYVLSVGTRPGGSDLLSGLNVGPTTDVSGAVPPGVYYVRVQAWNLMGLGPASEEAMFEVGGGGGGGGGGTAPGSPRDLSGAWSGANAQLSWTAPAGEAPSSYLIEAGSAPGATNFGVFSVGSATSYVAAGLPMGAYYVRVRAVTARGTSVASNEILLQRSAVAAPGSVGVLAAEVHGGSVFMNWEAPVTGGPVQGYVLEAGSSSGLSDIGSVMLGDVRNFTTPLPPGVYYVRVRAVNDSGFGAPSPDVVLRR